MLALLAALKKGKHDVRAVMEGPAKSLWQRRFSALPLYPDLHRAISDADVLLSSTGWASDLEHEARILAGKKGIYSIAVLDHWVNYKMRFVRGDVTIYPDELWVVDAEAYAIARSTFPTMKILEIPNFYLQEQIALLPSPSRNSPQLLYVLEPARNDWGRDRQGEFQALDYFVQNLDRLNLPAGTVINVRPHPSDPVGKYDSWIGEHEHRHVVLDNSPDMNTALARAAWVAGCETYALVLALAAGRHAYCTLPPWAPPCRLPQQGIIHLKDLR